MRIVSALARLLDKLLLGGMLAFQSANAIIASQIQEARVEDFVDDQRAQHSSEMLKRYLDLSISRLQRVESKAMGTLLGVGIAVALVSVTPGVLGADGALENNSIWARMAAAILILYSMIFLFGSGFLALQAYRIGEIYYPALDDLHPIAEQSTESQVQLYCITQNDRVALLRSNRLSVSFSCLRNGLAALVLMGILIVFATLFNI